MMLTRKIARTLLRWEWFLLLLLIPVTLLPFGRASALLALIPLLWLLRRVTTGQWLTRTPYDLAVGLMVVMLAASLTVLFEPSTSGSKIAGIVMGIALLYGTAAYGRQQQSLWPIVAFVLAVGTLMATVGLIGSDWAPPFDFLSRARVFWPLPGGVPGTVGGVINANELAGVLGWVLPLMLGCVLGWMRHLTPARAALMILLIVAMILIAFLLVATSSRGGMLGAGLGLVLVVAFYLSTRWRLVLAIGLVVGLAVLAAYVSNRLDQNIVGDTVGLSGRLEIWSRALLAITDFPLTGIGVNNFRRVVHVLYPLYTIPSGIDLGHAHNHLLQTALDVGLPGLVAYLAMWWISAGLLWSTYRHLRRRHATRHPYFGLVAGLAGSLLAGWMFGLFDAVSLGARPAFLWWLLLGLTTSVHYAVVCSREPLSRRHRRRVPLAIEALPATSGTVEKVAAPGQPQ